MTALYLFVQDVDVSDNLVSLDPYVAVVNVTGRGNIVFLFTLTPYCNAATMPSAEIYASECGTECFL